jgi:hypothetical protein
MGMFFISLIISTNIIITQLRFKMNKGNAKHGVSHHLKI